MKNIAVAVILIVLSIMIANIKFLTVSKALQATQSTELISKSHEASKAQTPKGEQDHGTNISTDSITVSVIDANVASPPIVGVPIPEQQTIERRAEQNTDTVESLVAKYAAVYKVDLGRAVRIAKCESTTGQNLVNSEYTAPDGSHPTGVYQFTLGTWLDFARQRGWPAIDERLNNDKNIEMTMWAWTNGYAGRWECK